MPTRDAIYIYTDGSSYSKPHRIGGIGILIVYENAKGADVEIPIESDGYEGATNNQMELKACIEALRIVPSYDELRSFSRIVIHSDSQYVVDNYTNAINYWSKQKWLNKDGRPIDNADLWKDLIKQMKEVKKRVEFKWVKGHSTNLHNRKADQLAKKSAKGYKNPEMNYSDLRRKTTSNKTKVGCVKMLGQRLLIRIVTIQNLRVQKVFKYRYEVLSLKSKFYGFLDFIYSDYPLRTGHKYIVTLNKNQKNPRISKIINEVVE